MNAAHDQPEIDVLQVALKQAAARSSFGNRKRLLISTVVSGDRLEWTHAGGRQRTGRVV